MATNGDALLLGATLGKYSFRYRIGIGATSEIWKCEEYGRGLVAAKFISRSRPFYKEISEYTKGEYEFYKSVEHPCLPKVYDLFENSRGYFMMMEFFDGPNLFHAFQTQRALYLPLLPILVKKMFNVVDFIHQKKVIHCDIKPENFLVDSEGRLFLIDFSLKRKMGFSFQNFFSKQKVEGTPEYMSPEQIKGKPLTYLSDYYSLGLVLYFLYTGKKAFEADMPDAILQKNLYTQPSDPNRMNPEDCCLVMSNLIKQLIEKKPQARIQSLREASLLFQKTKFANQNK